MKYFMGIDQGGTKTHAIVVDQVGKVLGIGKSYGACHSYTGLDHAINAVSEAVEKALDESGLIISDIDKIIAGMTGVDWDYESSLLCNALQNKLKHDNIKVVNDCIIAMRAGTDKENCAVICAGTGLNCAIKTSNNEFVYGFYIADEWQGGSAIGQKAVQAVFDSYLGLINDTMLTTIVLERFACKSVDELLYKHVNGNIGYAEYAKLARVLEHTAKMGDEVSITIWNNYGMKLAELILARLKKMELLNCNIDIVLSGSLLKCEVESVHEILHNEIKKHAVNANIITSSFEPIVGAALMAIDSQADKKPEVIKQNLIESAKKYDILR